MAGLTRQEAKVARKYRCPVCSLVTGVWVDADGLLRFSVHTPTGEPKTVGRPLCEWSTEYVPAVLEPEVVTATLLASDDPRIAALRREWDSAAWHDAHSLFPRAQWLFQAEAILRELHPTANSDSLTLTARTLAPFPLAKPGVP